MVVDIAMMKKKMRQRDVSLDTLCAALGISKSTFYRRSVKGGQGFTVENISIIKEILQLTNKEFREVFFVEKVA